MVPNNSYPQSTSEHSRAESESGASTVSETPEIVRSDMEFINRNTG